jgi:hypothetical protein
VVVVVVGFGMREGTGWCLVEGCSWCLEHWADSREGLVECSMCMGSLGWEGSMGQGMCAWCWEKVVCGFDSLD